MEPRIRMSSWESPSAVRAQGVAPSRRGTCRPFFRPERIRQSPERLRPGCTACRCPMSRINWARSRSRWSSRTRSECARATMWLSCVRGEAVWQATPRRYWRRRGGGERPATFKARTRGELVRRGATLIAHRARTASKKRLLATTLLTSRSP